MENQHPAIWYVRIEDIVYGPYTAPQLKQFGEEGRILEDCEIRKGHDGDCVKADSVKGLQVRKSSSLQPQQDNSTPEVPVVKLNSGATERYKKGIQRKGRGKPRWTVALLSTGIPLVLCCIVIGMFSLGGSGKVSPTVLDDIKSSNLPNSNANEKLSTKSFDNMRQNSQPFVMARPNEVFVPPSADQAKQQFQQLSPDQQYEIWTNHMNQEVGRTLGNYWNLPNDLKVLVALTCLETVLGPENKEYSPGERYFMAQSLAISYMAICVDEDFFELRQQAIEQRIDACHIFAFFTLQLVEFDREWAPKGVSQFRNSDHDTYEPVYLQQTKHPFYQQWRRQLAE